NSEMNFRLRMRREGRFPQNLTWIDRRSRKQFRQDFALSRQLSEETLWQDPHLKLALSSMKGVTRQPIAYEAPRPEVALYLKWLTARVQNLVRCGGSYFSRTVVSAKPPNSYHGLLRLAQLEGFQRAQKAPAMTPACQ